MISALESALLAIKTCLVWTKTRYQAWAAKICWGSIFPVSAANLLQDCGHPFRHSWPESIQSFSERELKATIGKQKLDPVCVTISLYNPGLVNWGVVNEQKEFLASVKFAAQQLKELQETVFVERLELYVRCNESAFNVMCSNNGLGFKWQPLQRKRSHIGVGSAPDSDFAHLCAHHTFVKKEYLLVLFDALQ